MVRVNPDPKSHASNPKATALPTPTTGKQVYLAYLKEAMAIPDDQVQSMGAIPENLVAYNVNLGVNALLPLAATIQAQLPKLSWEGVTRLPTLVMALTYADQQVPRNPPPPLDVKKLIGECSVKYQELQAAANSLVLSKVLKKEDFALVLPGHGPLVMANAMMALADVFEAQEKTIQGKTAVTPADVTAAVQLGSALHSALKPKNSKKAPAPKAQTDAVNLRDRFFTLVQRGYNDCRRAAFVLWLDDGEDKVPKLRGRDLGSRPAKSTTVVQDPPVEQPATPATTATATATVVPATTVEPVGFEAAPAKPQPESAEKPAKPKKTPTKGKKPNGHHPRG